MSPFLPWDHRPGIPTQAEISGYAEEHGVRLDVPLGAKKLGCMNCLVGDRLRHPELGMVYCFDCPVTKRRREGKGP